MKSESSVMTLPARSRSTRAMMGWTLVALLPSIGARIYFHDSWVIAQLALALGLALICDSVFSSLRGRSLRQSLDGSSAITAVLFALSIPPATPLWLSAVGIAFGLVLGRHAFGGLGRNLFNPAMLGYALLLTVFWTPMTAALTNHTATVQNGYVLALVVADLSGGLVLVGLRVVRWQTPLAFFIGVAGVALAFGNTSSAFSPALTSSNLVLAAFFIASDPVTGCSTTHGRWVFGFGAGALLIAFGRLPHVLDPLPFAILAMNALAPFIDHQLRARRAGRLQHG